MAMYKDISVVIKSGRVPRIFTPIDLMREPENITEDTYIIGSGVYKKSTITTNLNNFSIGPGERKGASVKRGNKPRYRKLSTGTFTLLNCSRAISEVRPEETEDSEITSRTKTKKASKLTTDTIYNNFIDYLSSKPFRLYLGNGKWYPENPIVGWSGRLNAYAWPLKTKHPREQSRWPATNKTLAVFTQRISELVNNHNDLTDDAKRKALCIYNDIRTWGNPRGSERTGSEILVAIRTTHAGGADVQQLRLDSTLTKLYAFTRPNDYVIYDSRVACAIVSIAEDIYRRDKVDEFRKHFPGLGHMDGAAQSGTRPRGRRSWWPNAYSKWNAQTDANKLCIGIRAGLNKRKIDGKTDWSLREVEAVLFMEGY